MLVQYQILAVLSVTLGLVLAKPTGESQDEGVIFIPEPVSNDPMHIMIIYSIIHYLFDLIKIYLT